MRRLLAVAAIVSVTFAVPTGASAATITVDPVRSCYREQQRVFLIAQGYTPNGMVDFTRDGNLVESLQADASGAIQATLRLPGLIMGQRPLTYVATDQADPARTARVSLVTTATDVRVGPPNGPPNRRLRIRARGFKGGGTLWAHVRRRGRRGGGPVRTRTVRIGRVEGPCWKVRARKRLFRRGTGAGRYRVQFDTFRRYKPNRTVEYDELFVTILSPASGR
ncbi:MAG TPA: hypothetical protein VGW14_06560 [Thermoleophilaceae bacterium]|nr:hypothetical protein [Thermoleophilaceae bacterium]